MVQAADVLWGKSNADGAMNLLVQHLLDAAAVAELIWDHFLAKSVRVRVDACCNDRGRALFALLCGLHDVGKASPAFQAKDAVLAARVQAAGLTWSGVTIANQRSWHHTLAGAVVVRRVLRTAGWTEEAVAWVWPMVAGHHGVVPGAGALRPPKRDAQGAGPWVVAQDELVAAVATALDVDLTELAPTTPSRATQLALLGAVIMADWLASDERHFDWISEGADVSVEKARGRARTAWDRLGLRGGWDSDRLPMIADPVKDRFGLSARPGQAVVVELAELMPAPGLLIVEAPMGEGKTEAALAAAEVLARRFGADGVFVGMPTQATSDPMYDRVRQWAHAVQPDVPVGLLHGKSRFNKEWQRLLKAAAPRFREVDGYGCDENDWEDATLRDGTPVAPAEWFLGPKRGLLMPVVVGTVDHLLHAATRTRHVMLRHAGLAGRVVVLDEVHAYDVYMLQFLTEALRWLADAEVPVVLLSATLPPAMRMDLVRAYLQGALARPDVQPQLPAAGYPNALAVCAVDGAPWAQARTAPPWRPPEQVAVDVLDERPEDGPGQVVALLREALRDGGCALVVHNTVRRAQRTYLAAREVFGHDVVVLLHARLAMGHRVSRTERLLSQLGPKGPRPTRLVVVATQLAEQSFDVDADLLVTDLAPIDLLLQRVGRLHRHARVGRPSAVAKPRVVVTGMARQPGAPWFPPGSTAVYGDHLLLRAAALVVGEPTWTIPTDVPGLVARGYDDDAPMPEAWADAAVTAASELRASQARRRARAAEFLLSGEGLVGYDALGMVTLAGLHDPPMAELPDEKRVAAVVRDGEPSVEVVLVRHDGRGYLTLDGRRMGPTGEAVSDEDVLEQVLHSTIRLPADPDLTATAERELRPLPGWNTDPWLRRALALLLDENLTARLGKNGRHRFTYDPDLGLLHERSGP